MIEVVNVLAGGYRRAGDRIRNPGVLKVKDTYELAVSPTRSFEHEPKCVSEDTGLLVGEFPTALIPREIASESPDRIRALICFGGDPLMAVGDPAFAAAGFGKLDLLVSLDSRMNATAEMADYVIATSQPFERHEISVPGDSSYPQPFVQYTGPVVARPEGVIDDWEFFWGVSARMGVPLTFKYWNYGLRFQDIPGGLPLSLTEKPDAEDLCRFLAADSVVPFDEIKAHPSGVRPELEPRFVKPGPPDAPGRLELCPPDVAAELSALAGEAAEQGFQYRLTCRRVLHTLNGAFRDSKEARRRFPVNYAHMSPEDMTADGIAEGDRIEIASEFGAIRTLAKSEARLRRGVISMTHMFGPLVGSGDPVADGGANVADQPRPTDQFHAALFGNSGEPAQSGRARGCLRRSERQPERRTRSATGDDDFDLQRSIACGDRKQAIDVRMGARAAARIRRMLGEDGQTVVGRARIQGAEDLFQVLIDGKRTLLSRLVFNIGNHGSPGVDKIDALQAIDGRQLLEIFLERRTWLNHRRHSRVPELIGAACNSRVGRPPGMLRIASSRPDGLTARRIARPVPADRPAARRRSSA
jgi:hypothetical protein